MVGHVMVLGNPKKKKRRAKRKGPRKMTALQKMYFGKGRRKKKRKVKETVIISAQNPKGKSMSKKRRHRRRHRKIRARSNPRRRFIRARSNPRSSAGGIGGFMSNSLMPAAIGAGGALAVDFVLGKITLPQSLRTATMFPIVRGVSALLLGAAIGAVAGEEAGEQAAAGGLVVAMYVVARSYIQRNMPSVQLARYVPMNRYLGRRRRALNGVRRRNMPRLAALPPAQRVAAAREMRRKLSGMGAAQFTIKTQRPGLGKGRVRPLRNGMGYIGPAKTLGRYVNNGRR